MPAVPQASDPGGLHALRDPIVSPEASANLRETPSVSFADLVRMVAEGIAAAQVSLDRTSAEMVQELAEAKIEIVPEIREKIGADGSVSYEEVGPRKVSLIEIGVLPTFYQFSQTTVEVAMDIEVVEEQTTTEEGKRRLGLFAGTRDLRTERKLKRDVAVHSKVTTTLVPVPAPLRLEPERKTLTPDA